MTPLDTALSSLRAAVRIAVVASSTLPDSTASRNLRTWVRSSDLTALLRWCAFSFVLMRLICDLMFATRIRPSLGSRVLARPGNGLPARSGSENEPSYPDDAGRSHFKDRGQDQKAHRGANMKDSRSSRA